MKKKNEKLVLWGALLGGAYLLFRPKSEPKRAVAPDPIFGGDPNDQLEGLGYVAVGCCSSCSNNR